MNRLSALLLLLLTVCALGLVTSQHRSRVLFYELERAKGQTIQLQARFNELEHEQTMLANAARVHDRARKLLALRPHEAKRTMHLLLDDETRLAAQEAAMRWRAESVARQEGR